MTTTGTWCSPDSLTIDGKQPDLFAVMETIRPKQKDIDYVDGGNSIRVIETGKLSEPKVKREKGEVIPPEKLSAKYNAAMRRKGK